MYVWVNLCDISSCEPIPGGLCIPLLVFGGCEKLGCYYKSGGNVDENYLVYKVDDESRARAMSDYFELVGKKKIGRKVRTRLTVKPPESTWKKLVEPVSEKKKKKSEVHVNKINDIDKSNWESLKESADSLWMFERDEDWTKKPKMQGAFVYQIPRNLIQRYTKHGDLVVDMFGGTGTTERACLKLQRSCVLVDIAYRKAYDERIKYVKGLGPLKYARICEDSSSLFVNQTILKATDKKLPKLVILHPPYYDVVKFSNKEGDMSTLPTPMDEYAKVRTIKHDISYKPTSIFLEAMRNVMENAYNLVAVKGFIALVFGDVYKNGRLTPAYRIAEMAEQYGGLVLKAIFTKNVVGNEIGKGKELNLWRYRALMGGFAVFRTESIYVWQRRV